MSPVFQDAIEAQRSQYPYYLPPTPQQEALQPSNILGDIIQRAAPAYSNFWFGKYGPQVTNVLSTMMPMALGLSGEEGGILGDLAERLPRGPTEPLGLPRPTAPLGAETGVLPGALTPGEHPARPTDPLPELAAQIPRYHGTPEVMRQFLDPLQVSHPGNMVGPGLYTTDNYAVGEGYGSGGLVYRVYEVNPVKLLDAENKPVPLSALKRAGDFLPGRTPQGGVGLQGWWPGKIDTYKDMSAYKLFNMYRGSDPESRAISGALMKALQEEGYGGLEHTGGVVSGGVYHRVKIYWNRNDVRLSPVQQDITKYVRDYPIRGPSGEILGRGWEKKKMRVGPPTMPPIPPLKLK